MQNTKALVVVLVLIIAVLAGVVYHQANEPKTPGEAIAKGIDNAADDVGDAVEDAGDTIQDRAH